MNTNCSIYYKNPCLDSFTSQKALKSGITVMHLWLLTPHQRKRRIRELELELGKMSGEFDMKREAVITSLQKSLQMGPTPNPLICRGLA